MAENTQEDQGVEADSLTLTLHESIAPHSVELNVNAKGKVQAAVKVYDADPDEAARQAVRTLAFIRKELGALDPSFGGE